MAEPTKKETENPENPAKGDGKGIENPTGNNGVVTELTPEQWKLAYESPRFKALLKESKEYQKLKKAIEDSERTKLEEQNKFKELYESEKKAREESDAKIRQTRIENAISNEAIKKGITDTDAVLKLSDLSKVTVGEDGSLSNVETVIDELLTARPYLRTVKKPDLGSGGQGAKNDIGKKFYTGSEYDKLTKDTDYYLKNQEELDSAMIEGRIDFTK